jgi:hypothetical protein
MPPVEALTIEYIYPDLTRRALHVHAEEGVTVGDVLAGAEHLTAIDLERDTSNNPYRSMVETRGDTECPCQKGETYFDHLRKVYGEAGLLKAELREDVWEFRFGRATRKSVNYPRGSHAHLLHFAEF